MSFSLQLQLVAAVLHRLALRRRFGTMEYGHVRVIYVHAHRPLLAFVS